MKRADTNPGVDTALDQERKMFYSANWQMLEERIDDDYQNSAGVNRRFQYIWGPRYIDDLAIRRLDGNADDDFSDAGTDHTYYHITDAQFSTVAVLNDAGALQERVSYDPYGRARHHKPADCSQGDGACGVADQNLVISTWGSAPAAGDVNRDGVVNNSDLLAVIGQWGAGLAFGQLSTTDNVIGWDGYVFNSEIDEDGLYTVRHRHYRPGLGRWLERDPAGYVDGLNLSGSFRESPIVHRDPQGLTTDEELWFRCPMERCHDCWKTCIINQGLLRRIGAGGAVICRPDGCRCACADRTSFSGGTPGDDALLRCVLLHEERHVRSKRTNCNCTPKPCLLTVPVSGQKDEECDASAEEIKCLCAAKASCGGDAACIARLNARIAQMEAYCLSFGGDVYLHGATRCP